MLRVLGVTRRRLLAMVLAEGAADRRRRRALRRRGRATHSRGPRCAFAGGDLGAGFFRGVEPRAARRAADATLVFFLIGVGVALLGSLAAGARCADGAPAPALKAGDEESTFAGARARVARPRDRRARRRLLAFALPPVGGLPLFGYVAIACLLIGTLLLMPWLASRCSRGCRCRGARPRGAGAGAAAGAPRDRSTVSLATIVASVSLVVSMAIMVTSFRSSLDAWLGHVLPADLYFRTAGVRRQRGWRRRTRRASPRCPASRGSNSAARSSCCSIRRDRGSCSWRARSPRPTRRRCSHSSTRRRPGRAAAPPPAWVNEAVADLYDFTSGRTIVLPLAGRDVAVLRRRHLARLRSAAGRGADRRATTFIALTGDRAATNAAIRVAPGASAGSSARDDRARAARRRSARDRAAGRDPRAVAERVRPHVRRHLCARDRRRRDRPDGPVVGVRRPGARAAARIRHAAPRRHDAPADRLDARHRGPGDGGRSASASGSCSAPRSA